MMRDEADLFGHAPVQASLFGDGENRMQVPQRSTAPNPDAIRLKLQSLLAKARNAQKMPWSERDARMWQTVFPNMANWLPDNEAAQMRLDFAREMERLSAA